MYRKKHSIYGLVVFRHPLDGSWNICPTDKGGYIRSLFLKERILTQKSHEKKCMLYKVATPL